MIISDYLSKKISFLYFFLIILVVFIHNYFGSIPPEGSLSYILQTTFSKGVCYVANPLFFIISGFLFFRKQEAPSMITYRQMLLKKLKTLVVPYLIVSALLMDVYVLFDISEFTSFREILRVWLLDPIPFQLWFLRYLMLMFILSPVIYYLIKKTKYIYITALLLAWFIFYYKVDWLLVSLTFFSVGAFISINGIQIPNYNKNRVLLIVSVLLWIGLSYLACIRFADNLIVMCLLRNMSIISGLVAVWLLYDCFSRSVERFLKTGISTYSFFIYLFHLPLILFVRRLLVLFAVDSYSILINNLIYIITPILTVAICIVCGVLLKKYLSPIYNILTGNR